MAAIRTARDRARAELTREIREEARRQLAVGGSQQLSLRAVARELGMASSAIYRYYPSRDDLLTALIIDAYDALGAAAEQADRPQAEPRERWRAVCAAARRWALDSPHEYALIYGSPVPGYQAPEATIQPATRVILKALEIVRQAGPLTPVPTRTQPSEELRVQAAQIAERVAPELDPLIITRLIMAWTQLFGLISFELFGQLANSMDPADEFFTHTTDLLADLLGL